MNTNREICDMISQSLQNTKKVSGFFVFKLVGLIISILLLLKCYVAFNINLEIVFAPLIVIAILAYAEKHVILLFLSPVVIVSKVMTKTKVSVQ